MGAISAPAAAFLDGQALAAFGTAGPNHGTTAPSLHPHQETVGALATNHGGLKSALHNQAPVREPQTIKQSAKKWKPLQLAAPVDNSPPRVELRDASGAPNPPV